MLRGNRGVGGESAVYLFGERRERVGGVRRAGVWSYVCQRASEGFIVSMRFCIDCAHKNLSRDMVVIVLLVVPVVYLSLLFLFGSIYLPNLDKAGECSCRLSNSSSMSYTSSDIDTAVIYLRRPMHTFHGNHWFHIGEHYVSRRKEIQHLLEEHESSAVKHIKVISNCKKLAVPMTKTSFSLFVLPFLLSTDHSIESVELYAPHTPGLFGDHCGEVEDMSPGSVTPFHSPSEPILGFYRSLPGDKFIDWRKEMGEREVQLVSTGGGRAICSGTDMQSVRCNKIGMVRAGIRSEKSLGTCQCAVHIGAIGEGPILPVKWFSSVREADFLRNSALSLCSTRTETSGNSIISSNSAQIKENNRNKSESSLLTIPLRLVIYQRDLNRRFEQLENIIAALQKRNTNMYTAQLKWEIIVLYHSEKMEPCTLFTALNSADVLLTAHGFQSTALMFMKRGAILIEIFPYKYHRTTYVPLADIFGLQYRWIQNTAPSEGSGSIWKSFLASISTGAPSAQLLKVISQGACMRDLKCRSYARSRDISMPLSHMQLVFRAMDDIEFQQLKLLR